MNSPASSPPIFTQSSLCVCVCPMGTGQIGSGLIIMTSFYLNHLVKDPISRCGHIRRSWGLGLPSMNLWRGTIQPITVPHRGAWLARASFINCLPAYWRAPAGASCPWILVSGLLLRDPKQNKGTATPFLLPSATEAVTMDGIQHRILLRASPKPPMASPLRWEWAPRSWGSSGAYTLWWRIPFIRLVPLAALLFIPWLWLAACKLAKPKPLILVVIRAPCTTHQAELAVGLVWICKLGNSNLLVPIRCGTNAVLLCSIDKVLGIRVIVHRLTHSIETIPAQAGTRTHWLWNGDGVKTSRGLVAFPHPSLPVWPCRYNHETLFHNTTTSQLCQMIQLTKCRFIQQVLHDKPAKRRGSSSPSIYFYFAPEGQKVCLWPHCWGLCNWNSGPRLQPLHLVLSQESLHLAAADIQLATLGQPGPRVSLPDALGWGEQPGRGGWREARFSQVLEPRSHTRLIPSLPNSDVVFSLWLFLKSRPWLLEAQLFSIAGVGGWGRAGKVLFTPNLKCSNRMAGPRVAECTLVPQMDLFKVHNYPEIS